MRWYEYKMETDDLYAPDDLKAKLLAMTDQLTEEEKAQPMMKTDAPVPAQSAPVQPKKKLIRFPAKRVGALAACLAVCVVGYGAFATGQIGLGAKSSSPAVYYSADSTAAGMAAGGADRAAVDSPMAADYSLNTMALESGADNGTAVYSEDDAAAAAHSYSPGTVFCREILFAYHVTVAFARNEKRVSVAYVTRTRAYDGRYEKGRQSHTFSGLPAVLLPFSGRFQLLRCPYAAFLLSSATVPAGCSATFSALPVLVVFSVGFSRLARFGAKSMALRIAFAAAWIVFWKSRFDFSRSTLVGTRPIRAQTLSVRSYFLIRFPDFSQMMISAGVVARNFERMPSASARSFFSSAMVCHIVATMFLITRKISLSDLSAGSKSAPKKCCAVCTSSPSLLVEL